MQIIDHAAHDALNEQRDADTKLLSVKTYDADQNGPVSQCDCSALALLDDGDKIPKGYTEIDLPKGGFVLGVFDGGHFARIDTGNSTRLAYLGVS